MISRQSVTFSTYISLTPAFMTCIPLSRCHYNHKLSNICTSTQQFHSLSSPVPMTTTIIECRRNNNNSRSGGGGGGGGWSYNNEGRRRNRVGELIRREIGTIIDDICARGSIASLVSVVNVKCSDDLRNARVNVSMLGPTTSTSTSTSTSTTIRNNDNDNNNNKTITTTDQVLEWLRKNRKEIRYRLAQSVHLKYVPDLSFHQSEMVAAVNTVNILNQLAQERDLKKQKIDIGQQNHDRIVNVDNTTNSDDDLDYDAMAEDALIMEEYEDDNEDDAVIIDVDVDEDEEESKILKKSEDLR